MNATERKEKDLVRVQFAVGFDEKPDKTIKVMACAFGQRSQLLASATERDGSVELEMSNREAARARLFLVAEPPKGRGALTTLADMEKMHAYEVPWKFDPVQKSYKPLPIPKELWKWWIWCSCRVRGTVVKPVVINGVTVEKPVRDIRVHICEVDRLYLLLARLPNNLLLKLRDELVHELRYPRPIEEPELGPLYSQVSLSDAPKLFSSAIDRAAVTINPQPEPPGINVTSALVQKSSGEDSVGSIQLQPSFYELPIETRTALLSSSAEVIRDILVKNICLLRPYLCLWPWFHHYLCRYDEITTVLTDRNGHFDETIWYRCFGDHPDLYFWLDYVIDSVWTTVHKPSVCCHTHWEYVCGSEVTIRATDPLYRPPMRRLTCRTCRLSSRQ